MMRLLCCVRKEIRLSGRCRKVFQWEVLAGCRAHLWLVVSWGRVFASGGYLSSFSYLPGVPSSRNVMLNPFPASDLSHLPFCHIFLTRAVEFSLFSRPHLIRNAHLDNLDSSPYFKVCHLNYTCKIPFVVNKAYPQVQQ